MGFMTKEKKAGAAASLEKRMGYCFTNQQFLNQALVHRSYSHEQPSKPRDNECLEFLGDSVLGLAVSHLLFTRYPECQEGLLSQLKASLVSENQLAQLAKQLNLGRYLLLGKGEALSGGRSKDSILSDTYEAVLAAVYLDGGLQPVQDLVERHFSSLVPESVGKDSLLDYKTRLQQYAQEVIKSLPEYVVLKESGPEHQKKFTVGIRLNGKLLAQGTGKNKKAAEQKAAHLALRKLLSPDT